MDIPDRTPDVYGFTPEPPGSLIAWISGFVACGVLAGIFGWHAGADAKAMAQSAEIRREHDRNLSVFTERHVNNQAYDAHRFLLKRPPRAQSWP